LPISGNLNPPIIVVPLESWTRITQNALRFALSLSPDVIAVYVDSEEEPSTLPQEWPKLVEAPSRRANLPVPKLEVLKSPYRYVIAPILQYVLGLEQKHKGRDIAVLVSNLVERRWYHRFLHNQRGELLTALLLLRGERHIAIINVPWYLRAG